MGNTLTLIAPVCACCAEPTPLLPRDDLPGGMAVCGETGQLYRPSGTEYLPAALPTLPGPPQPESVRIDLSQAGYA